MGRFLDSNLITPKVLKMVAASVWYRAIAAALLLTGVAPAQEWLAPVAHFPLASDPVAQELTIRRGAEALQPFTVAGKCGAFVGQQDGSFEAWTWPIKLLSHFRITAEIQDYAVPIDVNDQASEIEVAPDHTTITFAHAAFTVREILFATPCSANGAGVMALFEIDSVRPMKLTFGFTPEIKRMWLAPNYNAPSPEWVAPKSPMVEGARAGGGPHPGVGGYYILHTDSNALAGAVAMPGTEPGILAPYQERPKDWPLQLVLNYEPARDGDKYFPLLMAAGNDTKSAATPALVAQLAALNTHAAELYHATAEYYAHFFDTRLVAETPDPELNHALKWAELSIDQLRVQHGDEVALVAGLYSSGDSNRPGFGWYFGRDALYTLFAVDSYGDFALSRQELEFLIKRQREDGKIMHEYSQTADLVDWKSFPYEYAAADATPLFLMAVEDYVSTSGDQDFLKAHWAEVEKAYTFESTHDTDGDGIYDNSQGTGWVESWPVGMPHQEIYMASLDQQATAAYARLAARLQKPTADAEARAAKIGATLEHEYDPSGADAMYAFSRGKDGTLDTTATIYPTVAWFGNRPDQSALKHPDAMFRRWASHEFSTDWGTRDLGEGEKFYDPISYHQGSVWPLFTGWASLAEYRSGHPLSGYAHLMQNAGMTWSQDLGAVTELLSGQYFAPFGRSTTHQLWSSAMVLTPAIRGLFGVSVENGTITVDPHLPADWDGAVLHLVPVGADHVDVSFFREGASLRVTASSPVLALPGATAKQREVRIPLPGAEISIPHELPLPGARTAQLKVLSQSADSHTLTLLLEAQGGTSYDLPLRTNGRHTLTAEGATVVAPETKQVRGEPAADSALGRLRVHFPEGAGYKEQAIVVHW